MEDKSSSVQASRANAVGMGITLVVAAAWALFGILDQPRWLMVVALILSLGAAWFWAAGRRAMFPGAGRDRNRNR